MAFESTRIISVEEGKKEITITKDKLHYLMNLFYIQGMMNTMNYYAVDVLKSERKYSKQGSERYAVEYARNNKEEDRVEFQKYDGKTQLINRMLETFSAQDLYYGKGGQEEALKELLSTEGRGTLMENPGN
jgi:hypothetical protein